VDSGLRRSRQTRSRDEAKILTNQDETAMHRLTFLSALLVAMALGGCAGGYDRSGPWTNQHNPSPTAGW
jgi:hypothetical protein